MANRLDVESLRHPNGPALDEALHVLSPNQRDVIAKTLLEQVEKRAAMPALRLRHVYEDLRGSGLGSSAPSGPLRTRGRSARPLPPTGWREPQPPDLSVRRENVATRSRRTLQPSRDLGRELMGTRLDGLPEPLWP